MSAIVCHSCNENIDDKEYVNLDTKFFHLSHFICSECKQSLGGKVYFEKDEKIYCEEDYQKAFSPKCEACGHFITDQYVNVMEKNYHQACFVCFQCKKSFAESKFFNYEGSPCCQQCFEQKANLCAGCSQPIIDKLFQGLDKYWHQQCFVCEKCKNPFINEGFLPIEGKPYHQKCYQIQCCVCNDLCENEYYQVEGGQNIHEKCIEEYKKNHLKYNVSQSSEQKIQQKEGLNDELLQQQNHHQPRKQSQIQQQQQLQQQQEKKDQQQKQQEKKEQITQVEKIQVQDKNIESGIKSLDINNGPVYKYDLLVSNPPKDIDPSRKQDYLSEQEFQQVFGMSKSDFNKLPKWKQVSMKKEKKLF